MPLARAGNIQRSLDLEVLALVSGIMQLAGIEEDTRFLVADEGVILEAVPQLAHHRDMFRRARDLLAEGPALDTRFWTSADPQTLRKILPLLWHKSDSVQSFAL